MRTPLLLAMALLLASCSAGVPRSASHPRLGYPALFTLPAETGDLATVPERQAKATVVAFWSTDCSSCRQSLSALSRQPWQNDGVDLVLVAVLRPGESAEAARNVLSSWGVTRSFLVDQGGEVQRVLTLEKVPATWVLDAGGVLRWAAPQGATAQQIGAAAKKVAARL